LIRPVIDVPPPSPPIEHQQFPHPFFPLHPPTREQVFPSPPSSGCSYFPPPPSSGCSYFPLLPFGACSYFPLLPSSACFYFPPQPVASTDLVASLTLLNLDHQGNSASLCKKRKKSYNTPDS
jgi:hypothetical protein